MNNNYFRITGYYPQEDFSFILDSNGMHEKLWQFSAMLVAKGLKVLEVSKLENVIDININQVEEDKEHIFLRATAEGKPEYIDQNVNGTIYKAIKIADKIYIPNMEEII